MSSLPPPPVFSSLPEYGAGLADSRRWAPYVRAVLGRHGLPPGELESVFVGTYPTFLVDDVVVKLFGYFESWRADHEVELAVQLMLRDHPAVPTPALLAHGRLYRQPDSWPYLVTERLSGTALRDASLSLDQRAQLAGELGAAMRLVHDLPVHAPVLHQRDWLRDHGAGCADRHRAWGSLPARLVDQIGDYLVKPSPAGGFVHADLTADHIFVDGSGRLVGVIDWGDAMVTDPYYELGALHLGAFQGDLSMLRAFLAGGGWDAGAGFGHRAMSAALRHQFDLFADLPDLLRPARFDTLDALATALWTTTPA